MRGIWVASRGRGGDWVTEEGEGWVAACSGGGGNEVKGLD